MVNGIGSIQSRAMAKEEPRQPVARPASPGKPSNKSVPSQPAVNFIVYVLCVASLGAAVYSNVRLRSHDARIRSLESILRDSGHQWSSTSGDVVAQLVGDVSEEQEVSVNYAPLGQGAEEQVPKNRRKGGHEHTAPTSEEELERLQQQVAGIQHRLRRDVSQLNLIRPARQANDCMCPPGERSRTLWTT